MDTIFISSVLTLTLLGLIFGGGLAYASKKFEVKTDPRLDKVVDLLPGANCGGCGYPGCSTFAQDVLSGKAPITACRPGGREMVEKISNLLGLKLDNKTPMVAVVQCQGSRDLAVDRFKYNGIQNCTVAHRTGGGHKACSYGCLGFGDCERSCIFGAITMSEGGLPVVDENKCTGCGACVRACPRGIMQLIPITQQVYVGCVSQDRGKAVKDVCKVGCIGCTLCAKVTLSGAIKMEGNLPVIDPAGTDLVVAVHKCPTKSLVDRVKDRSKMMIDSKCDGCTECVKACPAEGAIEGVPGQRHKIVFDKCIGCAICIPSLCPLNAIRPVGALANVEESLRTSVKMK
jgi:Na+-translocating ferredoxin:NAD+ oxidoreductase RNF subunit RnfB